jgi:hypothetical protein
VSVVGGIWNGIGQFSTHAQVSTCVSLLCLTGSILSSLCEACSQIRQPYCTGLSCMELGFKNSSTP